MKTYTIIDLATDSEYTDTISNLVNFANNHDDASAEDFDVIVERRLAKSIRINFETWLVNFNQYQIRFGFAIKTDADISNYNFSQVRELM